MRGISLFYKGSWVEDIAEPVHPESLQLDYRRARSGFIRTIIVAYLVGFAAVLAISLILVAMDRLIWWRFLFNLVTYNLVAAILAPLLYRSASRTWLQAVGSGRALTVADITADAVYSAGPDTVITSWSKGAERILGWTADEIIGQSCAVILPEDLIEREVPALQKLLEDGIVTGHKTFNVRKSGEVFPTEASMTLLRGPDGSPAGFMTVLRDRSHQVQIEEELKRISDEMAARASAGGPSAAGAPEEGREASDSLRSVAEATVSALAAVAERRDPYTAGHQQRVSQLAAAIARRMGLTDDQVEGIRVAGILHDTGKVVIPGEILSKPSKLSEFEFGIIKTHPRVDSEIVEGIDFPWPVARAVLQHHERMDGSGYPSGLKADDIIIEARILAVADVVEAMASHRPYRPALGVEKALDEIEAGSGVLYDTDVVDACLQIFADGSFGLE